MIARLLAANKHIILYGISLALLLVLLKWLELKLIIIDHAIEIYTGAIAIIFTTLGIWVAVKLMRPRVQTVVVEKEVYINNVVEKEIFVPSSETMFVFNQKEFDSLGLSKRELEVLQLMADGLSNQEIASRLYLSLNTIKTHSSKLFEKLDVKRRTQAVEKAKRCGLLA